MHKFSNNSIIQKSNEMEHGCGWLPIHVLAQLHTGRRKVVTMFSGTQSLKGE